MLTKQAQELIGKRVEVLKADSNAFRKTGLVDTVTLDGFDANVRVLLDGGGEITVPASAVYPLQSATELHEVTK